MQAFMDVMANDLSGVRIRDQAQIQRAASGRQIDDIRHPNMVGRCRRNLISSRLEQVWMPIKTMKALRGLVIRAFGQYQQAVFGQYLE